MSTSTARSLPDVPVVLLPDDPTAGQVLLAEFAGAVGRIVDEDPAVRLGREESIHKARVSARRTHSQLRTFRPLFDEPAVGQLRTELRWLVDTLGVPRDLDVTLERIREGAPMVGPASSRRLQMAIQALEEARAKATEDLLSELKGARYVQLLDLLVDTIGTPPLTARADAPALGVLPAMVHGDWVSLRSKQRRLGRPPSHRELHKMRIAVKRVRYAAEATEPVVGKRARAFAKKAATLQDALGDACDAVLAEEWLRRWMGQDQLRPETVTVSPDGEPWRSAWEALDRKRLRSWMTATIDDR